MTNLHANFQAQLGRRPRLLLVDDQAINIQVLHQVLAADYQVLMATDGAQALKVCREQLPDLVLLDVQMPGMDGYEVFRQIRADPVLHDTPVIFVTADQATETEARGLEDGAVDFITKPFNPGILRLRLRTHLRLKLQSDQLRQMAFIDGLTGVHNRRYFDQQCTAEHLRAQRNGSSLALLLVDVDFFKRYNDHYGHLAGDDALRSVAKALRSVLRRPGDLLCRYGGEEFAVLLPETGLEGAIGVAQALERAVRELDIPHAASDAAPVMTISLGLFCGVPDAGLAPAAMIAAADEQLYRAKAQGRARYCAATPPAPSTPGTAAPLFECAAGYARELSSADVPLLQALLDANPEYFQTINGRNAHANEAQGEFEERPPPHLGYTRHFCLGLFERGGDDALVGVAIVSADLVAAGAWHIGLFLIASRLHGQGRAGQFYEGLEAWIRRSGAVWLRLGVVQGNLKAERFWARQGYQYLRERRDVDTGGRRNTVSVLLKSLGEAGHEEYLAQVPRDRPDSTLP